MRLEKLLFCALVLGSCSGFDGVVEEKQDIQTHDDDGTVELSAEIQLVKSSVDALEYDRSDPSSWNGDVSIRNVVYAAYGESDGHLSASVYSSDGSALAVKLKKGESYTVFAVANMGDLRGSLPVTIEGMDTWRVRLESYETQEGLPMSGSITSMTTADKNVKVPLQMLCHRLVLSVTEVKGFSLKRVRMRQAALDMTPFSSPSLPAEVGDGDVATDSDIAALNSGGTVDFYIFENMRGDLLPSNEDSWKKIPSSLSDIDARMATFVELTMDYDSGDGISGEVDYRFCLGEDVVKNFDVMRAKTKFLNFTPTAAKLYCGSWKICSDRLEDNRVLLFCQGSQNIILTQGSDEEVIAKIHYNTSNPEGYSSQNRPEDIGLCDKWMGPKWNFYPSTSAVQSRLQGLSISLRKIDECHWGLNARGSTGSGVIPVEIATVDGRVRDKAVLTILGKVNWDNVSEFLNDNPYGDGAYDRWFTVGMKKTMQLSGFSSTSQVTANIVSVSQDGRAWTAVTPVSSCDCLDICKVAYTSSTASITVGAKQAGYVKIRVDSPSTLQGQDFVVPVSDVDLRCDRNYTQESYSPLLTGSPRNLAIHCYLPGFDDIYGDGAFDNPGMNRTEPSVPYDYYDGIIPFSAFDSNASQTGYWDRYVRPVTSLAYRPGTVTRYLEFKAPGDNAYTPSVDSYGYSCCRYRLCDIPYASELSMSTPYASIRISKRRDPDNAVAVRNVFALPFFIPSQSPSYVGTIDDWSLFKQGKLQSGYQNKRDYQFTTTDYINVCKEAFLYSGAKLVAVPHYSLSDSNECIDLQYDGQSVINAAVSDKGKHALGRLDLYARLRNEVSGNVRDIYAGYLEVFLHMGIGARVVCSETTDYLPYTSNYSFPDGLKCYGYGISMEWMRDLSGKCTLAENIPYSTENSARYIVNGGQNDDTALINMSSQYSGYCYYRDPRLASGVSPSSLGTMKTLRYYKSTHGGLGPQTLWNTLWMGLSKDSINPIDDVNYVFWSAPYNERTDHAGEWFSARWPSATELTVYGPEANVKLYKYSEINQQSVEQTSGILYYIPSRDKGFVCNTEGLSHYGDGYLVIHDIYQSCPSTRGWLYNYEK